MERPWEKSEFTRICVGKSSRIGVEEGKQARLLIREIKILVNFDIIIKRLARGYLARRLYCIAIPFPKNSSSLRAYWMKFSRQEVNISEEEKPKAGE